MKPHKNDKFKDLYTSLELIEKEIQLKDELIATLKEQNELLEARIAQLFAMIKQYKDLNGSVK